VVACFWSHDVYAAQEQRVLPDGCLDLIWMDGAVHIAGPHSHAFLATLNKGQTVTGLRFRPGTVPGVLGVPAYPLLDQRVRLGEKSGQKTKWGQKTLWPYISPRGSAMSSTRAPSGSRK
jgi:uncharacterized protein DUF6597